MVLLFLIRLVLSNVRAVADQLEGNEEEHSKYRKMVVDYIEVIFFFESRISTVDELYRYFAFLCTSFIILSNRKVISMDRKSTYDILVSIMIYLSLVCLSK